MSTVDALQELVDVAIALLEELFTPHSLPRSVLIVQIQI
jgi:hypothetical protein